MTEQERKIKRDKFFNYLNEFVEKQEKSELINLTQIHLDYGSPKYKSPRRMLHYPRGKALIQYEIEGNAMCVEKVIRYDDNKVYGNFNLALDYINSIDAFNKYCYIEMLMKSEPDIMEKFMKL
jgi:hypothetical protein